MADLVGTTLNNQYYLRRLVGSGGMADVYEAFDKVRATDMAVKVLRRDLANNSKFNEAFKKEAKILGELQHPNIVRLYEFGRDRDVVYIVMAWVDGMDLKKKINERGQSFPLEEVSAILGPVCRALNFAHQMKVYHCDIKPANILLKNDGSEVLLTDFGVARWASERTGGGTVPYMAPEQFTSSTVSPRTDIYALGVTIYEMLSGGQVPFQGNPRSPGDTTRDKIAWEHVNMPLPDLRNYNPDLPEGVLGVIKKSLDKNPGSRYATPMEFTGAFEEARRSAGQVLNTFSTIIQRHPYVPPAKPSPLPISSSKQTPPSPDLTLSRRPLQSRVKRSGPHLFAHSGEFAGRTIIIPRSGLTIGRGADSQLRLLERSVSRTHARIFWFQRRLCIEDENSALGTYVNGQKLTPGRAVPIKHGDVIQTGYYQVFEFRSK